MSNELTPALLAENDCVWLAENLIKGYDKHALAAELISNGRPAVTVYREIDNVLKHPYIKGATEACMLERRRLAKANWTLHVLSKLDYMAKDITPLAVVDKMSTTEFYEEHYFRSRPCVITGALDEWPAITKWTPEYFIERWGDRMVEIQTGRNSNARYEIDSTALVNRMPFGDVVKRASVEHTNDFYMTCRNNGLNREALGELWDDIGQLPDYLVPPEQPAGYFWLGPAGTFTPLHHDLNGVMMAQVVGRKRCFFANSIYQPKMYNSEFVYSDVNLANIDYEKFPAMKDVRVMEWVLEPGQILFLPIGWWHQVEALDFSAMMSFTNFAFYDDSYEEFQANFALANGKLT